MPAVLLLDEPLSNLDAKLRVQVRRELRDLQQRLGLTTIFVTHDQEEANSICDRIAVMNDGVIPASWGTPMGLYERPANLFVANFLGTANILGGVVSGSGRHRAFEVVGGGRVDIPAAAEVPSSAKLVFRPQHVRFKRPANWVVRADPEPRVPWRKRPLWRAAWHVRSARESRPLSKPKPRAVRRSRDHGHRARARHVSLRLTRVDHTKRELQRQHRATRSSVERSSHA